MKHLYTREIGLEMNVGHVGGRNEIFVLARGVTVGEKSGKKQVELQRTPQSLLSIPVSGVSG